MSDQPTISVVVPCYNAEATLAATLDSVLAQDVDLEVIVVDDGSTDGSRAVLGGFGDRITTVLGPNRGASEARNSGIALARGSWIQFLDADDLINPGSLEHRLRDGLVGDVVICDWQEFSEADGGIVDGRSRSVDDDGLAVDPELAVAAGVWAPPAAVLYRRAVVDKIGGFRPDLPVIQDARYLFDAAHQGAQFVHSHHLGARYRVLEGSLSRRHPGQFWADVLLNGRQIENLWRTAQTLDAKREGAVRSIYDTAARGLLAARDKRFFEAEQALRQVGGGSRTVRTAGLLARGLGLANAHRVLSLFARA